jgi:hypothetical protein
MLFSLLKHVEVRFIILDDRRVIKLTELRQQTELSDYPEKKNDVRKPSSSNSSGT